MMHPLSPARMALSPARLVPVALLATVLSSCSAAAPQPELDGIIDRQWQVIGIYTSPQLPSAIPAEVVVVPHLTLGRTSAVGSTGCADFAAEISYTAAGDAAADTVSFDELRWRHSDRECSEQERWVHNRIEDFIATGNSFDMVRDHNDQLILTLVDERVDSPALRFAAP